jgi:DNA-binding NarL/FixJ family response regulator
MKEKTRSKAQIVVIDDHPVLRDGLMQLLCSQPDLECTGTADNTADARRLVAESAPDLMILDLRLKSGDTLDLIKSLRVEHPKLKVLVLSQYDEMLFAERVLRAGASGYVMKENATDEILTAVRRVLAGDIYFSQRIGASFIHRSLEEKPALLHTPRIGVERLSDRELQVFQLIAASFSTREIAEQFHLSVKTVETHRENIKSKLGLENAAELNEFARTWAHENLLPQLQPSTTTRPRRK